MTRDPRLVRLAEMAEMVLDARSVALRSAAERRLALQAQLDDLTKSAEMPQATDLAAARAAYAFESWAAARRADINLKLAMAQADWLAHLDEAQRAFGRTQVLKRMGNEARPKYRSAVLPGDLSDEDI